MRPLITMREAIDDRALFAPMLGGDSLAAWRALLIAIFGRG